RCAPVGTGSGPCWSPSPTRPPARRPARARRASALRSPDRATACSEVDVPPRSRSLEPFFAERVPRDRFRWRSASPVALGRCDRHEPVRADPEENEEQVASPSQRQVHVDDGEDDDRPERSTDRERNDTDVIGTGSRNLARATEGGVDEPHEPEEERDAADPEEPQDAALE